MKALLLAGGKGTRLRPLTNFLPKPMVPIMGKPLLELTIEKLKDQNVDEVVISTCYKSHDIKKYFNNGKDLGIKVSYITEDFPLGTGGAIKNAEKFFDDTFIVLNSDIVNDVDYRKLIRYHKKMNSVATIAMTRVDNPSQYGVIEFNEKGYIEAFKEKPKEGETISNWINAGTYIFEPEVFNEIESNAVVSVERETYPRLLQKGYKLAAYKYNGYWKDIGTIEKYKEVHKDILSGICKFLKNDSSIDSKQINIHPSAKIIEPVFIGENVKIGSKAHIGPYVVIGDNSYIGNDCTIKNSVLWNNVKVNRSVNLINSIVASHCTVDSMNSVIDTIFVNGSNTLAS